MSNKILVTGAAGFIGSHLVENLVKNSHNVIAFDRYNTDSNFGWLENSKYRKDIVNKDSAGNAKNYKITISSNITFTLNGNEQVSKVFERYAAFSSKSKKIDEGELVIETKEKLSKLISEDIVFFIINQ